MPARRSGRATMRSAAKYFLTIKHTLRLSAATLNLLPAQVARPRYDRDRMGIGIVHLGVGAFHKAHQAVYTDDAMAHSPDNWGIVGISLKRPDSRDQLAPQDYLYSVGQRDNNGEALRVIGAIKALLVAPENPHAVLAQLAQPQISIITLTITEKGYCLKPDGSLDLAHPDIQHDLNHHHLPRSAIGYLARGLALRRRQGGAPPTILSCDNLPGNGARLRAAVVDFSRIFDPATADWCVEHVRFPSSMVDRIVPASTETDIARFQHATGLLDAAFVSTEPFHQWVIEDDFPQPRPAWEAGGAQFVRTVAPYETVKLRLLNGAHSAIAYIACLAGYTYVHEAIADPLLARFIAEMMEQEIVPCLDARAGPPLSHYCKTLLARFSNRALAHRTLQIAMDGSQKLPLRILETVRERLARQMSINRLSLVVAAWLSCLANRDNHDRPIAIVDPLATALTTAMQRDNDPAQRVQAALSIGGIFGNDLPSDPRFTTPVTQWFVSLTDRGVEATLRTYLTQQPE